MSIGSNEEARSRLEAIIDAAIFAIITIDERGVVEDFNRAAEAMFGYASAEVVGRNVTALMPEPYRSEHDGYIRRYLDSGTRQIIGIGREVVGLRKDGSTFPVHLSVSEVRLADRTLFTGIIEDITARRQAEERVTELQNELIHVARLSAMGELASALAHELNQPLTAVSNYANAARRMLDFSGNKDPHTASELLLKASDQALRAGEIIRRLRQFIEWGETERAWEDLQATVEEAAQLGLVGTRSRGIAFSLNAEADLPRVMIDRIQIQQVVQNLVRNAVDAMDDWDGEKSVEVTLSRISASRVEVAVADTGPGLAKPVKARLFEPFVTTKTNGMGIGLSVCRNIVESHGGRISAEDRRGGGTRFLIALPIEQA
ncbi:MAG: PAS domain S-box protein [Hyphomicrobiales bacterium]|nr:PAS domain S-box protein [Hyphomicrobiales bacterium]